MMKNPSDIIFNNFNYKRMNCENREPLIWLKQVISEYLDELLLNGGLKSCPNCHTVVLKDELAITEVFYEKGFYVHINEEGKEINSCKVIKCKHCITNNEAKGLRK